MTQPVVHVYTLCKNEIEILPFFLAYYETIADKIIIFDNESTDGSQEYIKKHPKCTLIEFKTNNLLRDDIQRLIKNSAWKESKGIADWVIVSDIDEFLFHKDLKKQLLFCKKNGVTIPRVAGFNMLSEEFPKPGRPITDQVKYGAYSTVYCKFIVFDPNKIEDINYVVGGHFIEPEGEVNYGKGYLFKLLHYKLLGNPHRLQKRWQEMGDSLSQVNVTNNWGIERVEPTYLMKWFDYTQQHAELVVDYSLWQWRSRMRRLFKRRDPNPPY